MNKKTTKPAKSLAKKLVNFFALALLVSSASTTSAMAANFTLKVSDIENGGKIPAKYSFNGFGCSGKNISPKITWKDAPSETKSFALTVYDPDAPTGSGWWHWVVVNISATKTSLPANFGEKNSFVIDEKINQIQNDYSSFAYGGPCPPVGDKPHRYIFTLHALKTEKIELKDNATAALAGYFINQNSIAKATVEGLFGR